LIATQGGISRSLLCGGRFDYDTETFETFALRADGFDASEDGTGRGTPLTLAIRGLAGESTLECRDDGLANAILTPNGGRGGIGVGAVAFNARQDPISGPISGPIDTDPSTQAVAFAQNQRDEVHQMAVSGALAKESGMKQQTYVSQAMAVRRLTPLECERLMGFPDNFTAITRANGKLAADGPRYKALGNSMAVPVMSFIGKRIMAVEEISCG